jgi:hypothetical protein
VLVPKQGALGAFTVKREFHVALFFAPAPRNNAFTGTSRII